MQKNVQVLSQLLWDIENSSHQQKETIEQFYRSLILAMDDSGTKVSDSPFHSMATILKPPLELMANNPSNMAAEYLKYCLKFWGWPYDAFFAALISIMEDHEVWSPRWKSLTAKQTKDKIAYCSTHKAAVEKLYANNIIKELKPAIDSRKKTVQDYYRMHSERESFVRNDHYFVNLKGLSSSSPIIYNSTFGTHYRGGGFYFCWNHHGVVVDPGLHFVTNMHERGLNITDIDTVVITHNHIDHKGDMQLLEDLEYQIIGTPRIKWYVCKEIYDERYSELKRDNRHPELANLFLVEQGSTYNITPYITLCATRTDHILIDKTKNIYSPTTFGCMFTLAEYSDNGIGIIPERTLGYTSDSTYWDNMEQDYDSADLLIANISSIREQDLLMEKKNPLHLGFSGCISLLQGINQAPTFFLLSEFWNGIDDIRFSISKQLRRITQHKGWETTILPAEIGMEIDLSCMGVRCSACGSYSKRVSLIKPQKAFGEITFLCDECILSP